MSTSLLFGSSSNLSAHESAKSINDQSVRTKETITESLNGVSLNADDARRQMLQSAAQSPVFKAEHQAHFKAVLEELVVKYGHTDAKYSTVVADQVQAESDLLEAGASHSN